MVRQLARHVLAGEQQERGKRAGCSNKLARSQHTGTILPSLVTARFTAQQALPEDVNGVWPASNLASAQINALRHQALLQRVRHAVGQVKGGRRAGLAGSGRIFL